MKTTTLFSLLKLLEKTNVIAHYGKIFVPENDKYEPSLNADDLKRWMDKHKFYQKLSEVEELFEELQVSEINPNIHPLGLYVIEEKDYDAQTIAILKKHFKDSWKVVMNWFSQCYNLKQPKAGLNIWGLSNIGKSHLIRQITMLMNYTLGDLSNDEWVTNYIDRFTMVIIFADKIGNLMNHKKFEIMKRMHQGEQNIVLLNSKCCKKINVMQCAGWYMESQLPMELYVPEENQIRHYVKMVDSGKITLEDVKNTIEKKETFDEVERWYHEWLSWKNRIIQVEFVESGLQDPPLDLNTIYSILMKGV